MIHRAIDSRIAAAFQGNAMGEFVVAVTLPGTPERFTRTFSGSVIVGRADDAGLQLAHPLVSRHHVELSLTEDGRVQVRDLGSRNGTLVNDKLIQDASCEVDEEAHLQVGPYLLLVGQPANTISETLAFDAPRLSRRAVLDEGKHSLTVDGRTAIEKLTGLEFGLLEALSEKAPDLVGNSTLGDRLWGEGQWDVYMLHNLVRRVRRKLEEAGFDGEDLIQTVPGVGYRLA